MASLALAAVAVLGLGGAAQAGSAPALTAEPTSIEVGAETTVTATGLGAIDTAFFGLDDNAAGTLMDTATGQESTSIESAVTGGSATVKFRAAREGTVAVAVGTGETVAATVAVTVSAAAPTPTAAPTVTVTATPPVATPEPSMTTMTPPATDAGFPGGRSGSRCSRSSLLRRSSSSSCSPCVGAARILRDRLGMRRIAASRPWWVVAVVA